MSEGPVWALGAMSGTSLDGVDAAMVLTDGTTIFDFGECRFRPYAPAERAILRAALGRWQTDDVTDATEVVETAHAELLAQFSGAELIGFHGQTLAHAPRGRGTHQAGCGRRLAAALGVPVVWDFRSDDVARGGEGAPLAPFYHFACARWVGAAAPMAFLNLGGVGNLTWLDPRVECPETPGACLAFDTGPANAPIDDLVATRLQWSCDRDGLLAAAGRVDEGVVQAVLAHEYFARPSPKSLDRNDFPDMLARVARFSDADAAATLTAVAAAAVVRGLSHCPTPPQRLLVTGGGRRNATLMAMLAARTGCPTVPIGGVGLDGDMLEAQAFAYLAVRVARELPTSCAATTGVTVPVSGGRISRPGD